MPSEHRLHPTSILFALAGSLRAFLLPAVFLLFTTGRSSNQPSPPGGWGPAGWMNRQIPGDFEIANWQLWLLLLLIPSTIIAITRYLSFRIRYEGTELVIRSGIIFRNERHVPYLRIQNLDAVRNIAHRLLGVAEVRVETGGGETPEATISVLHEPVFEEMRRRIFEGRARAGGAHAQHPATPESIVEPVESRTLLHLPIRELLLNGVLDNRGMILVATAYGVLWEAGLFRAVWDRIATGWYGPGLLRETAATIAAGQVPPVARLAVILAGIIGLIVIVRILSMIWSVVRLYEFRLSRVGEDLRTEYGLLTRVTTTIPKKRVQTLTIREAPLQRLVGRMSMRVDTAGGHGNQADQQVKQPRESLAPLIRRAAVPALVREVLPGIDLSSLAWEPLHPRAFRRAIKPAVALASMGTAALAVPFGWFALMLLPFTIAWVTIATRKHVQHMQWATTDEIVAFRSGWLWRSVTVAPIGKIQALDCIESPFDRRHTMAGVQVDTAGGAANRISIPYLARDTAAALYKRLAAQTAQTAFRW
jgi:putative membrane protein